MSTRLETLGIDQLTFDPKNPRLPSSVNGADRKAVIDYMLRETSLIELMSSIAENGYSPAEPIWVVKDDQAKDKYIVVEGNRRFTAVLLLNNPELANVKKIAVQGVIREQKETPPTKLPAVIFSDKKDALKFLGYRHITGVESWDALQKARYLKSIQQSSENTLSYSELAKLIGSRPNYVKLILNSLDVQETIERHDYFNIPGLNDETIQFGTLYTALQSPSINNFINFDDTKSNPSAAINIGHLQELTEWMFKRNAQNKTLLGESRNIKHLSKILDSNRALKAFREGKSLNESLLLTDEPKEIITSSVDKAMDSLKTANEYLYLIEEPVPYIVTTLTDISKLTNTMRAALQLSGNNV